MSTIINGSSPSITFSDSTTQASAGLVAGGTIATGTVTTLTTTTISDGTNSTSATNCIQGSAKAWVNFGYVSSAITIRKSYNVSSVTRNGTGDYTINFTTALNDANYSGVVSGNQTATVNYGYAVNAPFTSAPTTTTFRIATLTLASALTDFQYVMFAAFD